MDKNIRKKFIKNYIRSSQRRLKNIDDALKENDFAYVVRVSQEIFELLSKSLLLKYNFVVPKTHNLSEDLDEVKELYSTNFQKEIYKIIKLSKELRRNREKAFYGDEEEGIAPDELYNKKQAQEYQKNTKWFYDIVIDELSDYLEEETK